MKPNLFAFATKELSQDAFLAWLLQWADPECRQNNAPLHEIASAFVRELIGLQGTVPSQITKVKAGRQWDGIDVWAEVNDSHLIIIEDKVGTGQHSGQLARYRATGERWCKEKGWSLICVYLKTQSDSSCNLSKIEEQGFATLSRGKLLALLEDRPVENTIYNDFTERLREIESQESQFEGKRIGDWDDNDWKGFYRYLEQEGHVQNWGYAANPAGGFWYAILSWLDCDGVCPYIQIEQGNLCFKVGEVAEDRRDTRMRFFELLMAGSREGMGLERPARFGNGATMTVALVRPSVWLCDADDKPNLDAILKRLKTYMEWFAETMEQANRSQIETAASTPKGLAKDTLTPARSSS